MSQPASQRRTYVLVGLFALAVVVVIGVALSRLGGDDTKPVASGNQTSNATALSDDATSSSPTPTETPTCEGPDTQFNVEGTEQDSLLPDCGVDAVTKAQQQESGLSLACGGTYPVILYKTSTTDAKTSICGKTSSGEEFRFVTRANGGSVLDLRGVYDPQRDAFLARNDGTTYAVHAYDGTLLVTRDGSTTSQKSSDWISLDNEPDFD